MPFPIFLFRKAKSLRNSRNQSSGRNNVARGCLESEGERENADKRTIRQMEYVRSNHEINIVMWVTHGEFVLVHEPFEEIPESFELLTFAEWNLHTLRPFLRSISSRSSVRSLGNTMNFRAGTIYFALRRQLDLIIQMIKG